MWSKITKAGSFAKIIFGPSKNALASQRSCFILPTRHQKFISIKGVNMEAIAVNEQKLEELIEKAVQKHLKVDF